MPPKAAGGEKVKFKIILASDPKLPFRVCVPSPCGPAGTGACTFAPRQPRCVPLMRAAQLLRCGRRARRVNVPEAAPFTAVIKYVADEVDLSAVLSSVSLSLSVFLSALASGLWTLASLSLCALGS